MTTSGAVGEGSWRDDAEAVRRAAEAGRSLENLVTCMFTLIQKRFRPTVGRERLRPARGGLVLGA